MFSVRSRNNFPPQYHRMVSITCCGLLISLFALCFFLFAQDQEGSSNTPLPKYVFPVYAVPTVEEFTDYKLWSECRKIWLLVAGLPEDATKIGLTEEMVQTLFESRLRSSRLFEKENWVDFSEKYRVKGSDDERLTKPAEYWQYFGDQDYYASDWLYVNVNVVGQAFSYSLDFKRWLPLSYGRNGSVTLWSRNGLGTHGGDSSNIMNTLSEKLDGFIQAYLKVNERACEGDS